MTDEQIIKAFEEILKNQNNKLSLIERAVCDDVLSLANRQKAEIERLEIELKTMRGTANTYKKWYHEAKSEAIKEFAENLKEEMRLDDDCKYDCAQCHYDCKDYIPFIGKLVKEMTEADK